MFKTPSEYVHSGLPVVPETGFVPSRATKAAILSKATIAIL